MIKRLIGISALVIVGLFALNARENPTAAGHHPEYETAATCQSKGFWEASIVVVPDSDREELTWRVHTDTPQGRWYWGDEVTATKANAFSNKTILPVTMKSTTFTGTAVWSNGVTSSFSTTVTLDVTCVDPPVETTVPISTTTTVIQGGTTTTVVEITTTTTAPVETSTTFDIGTPVTSIRVLPKSS